MNERLNNTRLASLTSWMSPVCLTTQSPWAMHFCFPHSAHTGSLWTWGFFRWNMQNYKTHTPTEVAEGSVLLPPLALVALHCEVARPGWDLIGDHLFEMVKVILPYATCQCEVHAVQQFLSLSHISPFLPQWLQYMVQWYLSAMLRWSFLSPLRPISFCRAFILSCFFRWPVFFFGIFNILQI